MGLRGDGPWPGLWPGLLSRLAIWFKINCRLPRAPRALCLGLQAAAKAESAARPMPPRKQMSTSFHFTSCFARPPECSDLLPGGSRERRLWITLGRTTRLTERAARSGWARDARFTPVTCRTRRRSATWNTERRAPRGRRLHLATQTAYDERKSVTCLLEFHFSPQEGGLI